MTFTRALDNQPHFQSNVVLDEGHKVVAVLVLLGGLVVVVVVERREEC